MQPTNQQLVYKDHMGDSVKGLLEVYRSLEDRIAFNATVRNGSASRLPCLADRLTAVSEHIQRGISKA